MKRCYLILAALAGMYGCRPAPDNCAGFGDLSLYDSLEQATAQIRSDSQFVLVQVLDSSAASSAFLRYTDSLPCFRYRMQEGFAAHYRVSIEGALRREPRYVFREFAGEYGLRPPFFMLLGRKDTVFAFAEIYNGDPASAPDSVLAFLLREQAGSALRDDITFLHGAEKEKRLRPRYYAWVKSVTVSGYIGESPDKKLWLHLAIRNPDRYRIVAPGTDQRSYLAPLRLQWNDTLLPAAISWKNTVQGFSDPFLKKKYLAYTDTLISGEAILNVARGQLPEILEGRMIFSVYIPQRKVAVNSVEIPLQVSVHAPETATRTSE